MSTRKLFLLLVFSLFYCSTVHAESANALKLLIESGLNKNPELREAYHRWQAKRAATIHKTALADPVVNFRHNLEPIQTRTGEQNQVLTISQMLPFPGKQKTAIRLNHRVSELERILYDIKLRDLILSIKKSYAEIYFLRKAVEISQTYKNLIELINDEVLANQNSSTLVSVLKAQSQLAQNANDLITYSELLQSEKAGLRALTGLEELPDEWFSQLPLPVIPATQTELLEEALKNRLEIKLEIARNKVSESKLRLAKFENRPDFTVGFSQALTGSRPDLNGVNLKGEGTDAIGVFVQLNLPIWQNKNRSRIQEARHEKSATESRLQAKNDDTRAGFSELWFKMANRARLHQIYQETILPQAMEAAETTHSLYLLDRTKFADYLEASNNFNSLQIAACRAEADLFISATEIERYTNSPLRLTQKGGSQ